MQGGAGLRFKRPRGLAVLAVGLLLGAGCRARARDDESRTSPTESAPASPPASKRPGVEIQPRTDIDVLTTHLKIDVSARRGVATITLAPGPTGATLDVGDLELESVQAGGTPLAHRRDGEQLHLAVPAHQAPFELSITYRYQLHGRPLGAHEQLSLTWPDACGRIFPCRSEPADGVRFSAELTGVPDGEVAFFPEALPIDSPPYMFGWAYGDYEVRELGRTEAGTLVRVAAPESAAADAVRGTAPLLNAFDFLERTYGPYAYGDTVTTVWVDWGGGAYGGMEHHPHWHVSSADFEDTTVHVHEAAHGWFGNGVRIACWEDFVFSEALASYLAARGLEAAGGDAAAKKVWATYREDLDALGNGPQAAKAWPEGCGEHHVIDDGIFGPAPYMRGAFLLRAIEGRVGREALDQSLREFYLEHRGQAVRFGDLLDAIEADTGFDPHACAEAWLREPVYPQSLGCDD